MPRPSDAHNNINKINTDFSLMHNPEYYQGKRKINITPELVTETRRRFREGLKKSPFRTYAQWAFAADMALRNFIRAQRCQSLPNIRTAAVIAGVAGLKLDDLYGHLLVCTKQPQAVPISLERIDLDGRQDEALGDEPADAGNAGPAATP